MQDEDAFHVVLVTEMSDQVPWGVSNMVHHLTELTYMLLRCLLLVAVSEGVAGAVMTFLIVRS